MWLENPVKVLPIATIALIAGGLLIAGGIGLLNALLSL